VPNAEHSRQLFDGQFNRSCNKIKYITLTLYLASPYTDLLVFIFVQVADFEHGNFSALPTGKFLPMVRFPSQCSNQQIILNLLFKEYSDIQSYKTQVQQLQYTNIQILRLYK